MTGAMPTLAIATGISNSIWRKKSKCVCVCAFVVWSRDGVLLRSIFPLLQFQRPNRIKTGAGVDYPPPHQYSLLSSPCCLQVVLKKTCDGLPVTPQWSVMDNTRGKYFQFSKEMKITLAVDASVNWLEKLLQYKRLRESIFSRNPPSDECCVVASGQSLNEPAVLLNEHIKKNQYLC